MRNKNVGMWTVAGLFCGGVMWFVGCNRGNTAGAASEAAPAQPSVAVVNLDSVARDLGWADKLKNNEETYHNQLKSQMDGFAAHYRADLDARQRALAPNPGDKLTPAQVEMMRQMVGGVQQEMHQLDGQATQLFQNYRLESAKRYRDALTPLIREVSQSKKMTIALMQNDLIIFADPTVDLTNAVSDAARAHMPTLTEVSMTPIPAAPELPPINANGTTQPTTSSSFIPSTSTTKP